MIKTDITRSFKGMIYDVGIWLYTPLAMTPWQVKLCCFCFILFRSISFYFILFHFISFHSILAHFPSPLPPTQGAQNTLYAATAPEVKQGAFYEWFEAVPPTWSFENVDEVRDKLWKYSVERVGVKDFENWKEMV